MEGAPTSKGIHVNYARVILSISNAKLAQAHHCVAPMVIFIDWKHKEFVAKHISVLQAKKRQMKGTHANQALHQFNTTEFMITCAHDLTIEWRSNGDL